MQDMLKIGEFARLCGTGTQTIRYYDSVGILPADRVDNFTGYRYYHPDKWQIYQRIKLYQEIGFSLEDIKLLVNETDPATGERREALLSGKRRALLGELNSVQGKLARLENISHERARLEEQNSSAFFERTDPFEPDDRVLGKWELLGELDAPSDGEAPPPEALLIEAEWTAEVWFLEDGKPWWTTYWSRGTLYWLLYGYHTILPMTYTLWERSEGRYMTLRMAFPPSIPLGARPRWLLYRQTEHRALSEREAHIFIDRTDYPLLPDSIAVGEWEAVDFVDTPSEFSPDAPSEDRNSLWMVGMTLNAQNICTLHVGGSRGVRDQTLIYTRTDEPHAELSLPADALTKGVVLRPADAVAARYFVRCVGGAEYLFLQHKSGDYIYGGIEPTWYVFRRPVA